MAHTEILRLLFHGNQLKRTKRTGWLQRGIVDAEDVAAHTFGVAFTALILSQAIEQDFNREKVLIMALLHDLPEGMTTDIPTTAWRFFKAGIKTNVEREAMTQIVGQTTLETILMTSWEELQQQKSLEAQLVHDADKLDMFLQAFIYERQTGNRQLQEFWERPHRFFYDEAQNIYEELISLRNKE
jgi:putative hydrolase of HD superfamily